MGTYWEKVERMADIAEFVASFGFPAKAKDCRRAAFLSKADLTTGVIKEFPELQGVMGGTTHRRPASRRGGAVGVRALPAEGTVRRPADHGRGGRDGDRRQDRHGVRLLRRGAHPDGNRGPLRPASSHAGDPHDPRIPGLRIPIAELVDRSLATLAPKLTSPAAEVRRKVLEFVVARYLNLMVSQGAPADLVEAVLAPGLTNVVDLRAKLDALVAFRADAAFEPLAESSSARSTSPRHTTVPLRSRGSFSSTTRSGRSTPPRPMSRAASLRRRATGGTARRSARWRGSAAGGPPSSKKCS